MTQLSKAWDLAWSVDGDDIQLEQDAGIGEVHAITLHRMHLRQIATEAGLLSGDPDLARRVATLERRLRVLCDRVVFLDDQLWAVPVFPPGSSRADPENLYSQATRDLAEEWLEDLGLTVVDELEATQEPSHATERQVPPRNAKPNPCEPVTGDAVSQPRLPGLEVR